MADSPIVPPAMSYRNGVFIAFSCVLLGCAVACSAQSDDPAESKAAARSGVLVFRNGRVIEGQIISTESHYIVIRPVGKIEVPKSQIESVAKDLEEVYRKKAGRIKDRDPDEHMRLAQWCLQVNLHQRAIEELERVVEQSSDTSRATAMLENLRRMQARSATKNSSGNKDSSPSTTRSLELRDQQSAIGNQRSPAPPHSPPTKAAAAEGSDSELVPVANAATRGQGKASAIVQTPPAMVSSFSVRIQPLLVRSCAAAGCHDLAHAGALALERSSQATPRSTQQNLRSVLSLIDANDPENSPLVIQSLLPHGGNRRPALALGVKDPAYQTLLDWVRGVAGKPTSKSGSEPPLAKDSAATAASSPQAQPTSAVSNQAGATARRSEPAPAATKPADSASPSRSLKPPMDDAYQPIDAFDPEIFNRQFSKRAAGQEP